MHRHHESSGYSADIWKLQRVRRDTMQTRAEGPHAPLADELIDRLIDELDAYITRLLGADGDEDVNRRQR